MPLHEILSRQFFVTRGRMPTELELLDYMMGMALDGYLEAGLSKGQIGAHVREILARSGV